MRNGERARAAEWLVNLLHRNEPLAADEVFRLGVECGLDEATVRRAARDLGVQKGWVLPDSVRTVLGALDEVEWGFYVVSEDRTWDWSNHVWTLGWVCNGHGREPEDAWQEALDAERVPEGFDLSYLPSIAIRTDHERTVAVSETKSTMDAVLAGAGYVQPQTIITLKTAASKDSKEIWVTESPAEVQRLVNDTQTRLVHFTRVLGLKPVDFSTRPDNVANIEVYS